MMIAYTNYILNGQKSQFLSNNQKIVFIIEDKKVLLNTLQV